MHMWIKCTRIFIATLLIIALNNTNNKMIINKNELTRPTYDNTDESHTHSTGPKKPYTKEYYMIIFILSSKVNKTKLKC